MLQRWFWIFTGAIILLLPLGCSTHESQEGLNTVLCWLRPSCLPSQPRGTKPPTKPIATKQSTKPPTPRPIQPVSSPKPPARNCLTSAKTTIQASKPSLTVSYVEPTTNAKGQPLTNLAKTTIYHDLGKGLVKYKDISATNPQGGGTIQEKITLTLNNEASIKVTICVTATNTHGQEG